MAEIALETDATERGEQLSIEAAQRDPSHFAELYQANFERVYAFIVRRVRDRDVAEDLTSDVFRRALANLRRYEWRGVPFAAWLLRIAANTINDWAKRAAQERGDPCLDEPIGDSPEDLDERARLFKLVDQLPGDQRRVIVMRFAEQKSIREAAHELGRSEGAVKQLQFRALQTLRTLLGERDD